MNEDLDLPYNIFQKALAYSTFLLHSKNRHGVHSPFVYDFIENVLNPTFSDNEIEKQRKILLNDHSNILLKDYGKKNDRETTISQIAETSLKKPKEAQLLSKISSYYSIQKVVELGTSLGITTAYFAKSSNSISITTIEGSEQVLEVAKRLWSVLNLHSIHSINSDFDSIIDKLLDTNGLKTLYFIDGNHRYAATLKYFKLFLENCDEDSIVILDDIHWSPGMEKAWAEIIALNEVTLSIDLFEMGVIFFKKRLKKEHFTIRY